MDQGKWTTSPDQSSLLMVQAAGVTAHQGGFGLEYEDEDGEESRLDFNFEAIDADIDLDDSMQSSHPNNSTNPRMLASLNGGRASSLGGGMTDSGELVGGGGGTAPGMGVPRSQKTIDRWSAGTGKPATMTLKEQEKVGTPFIFYFFLFFGFLKKKKKKKTHAGTFHLHFRPLRFTFLGD